jgi:hypothetical protein
MATICKKDDFQWHVQIRRKGYWISVDNPLKNMRKPVINNARQRSLEGVEEKRLMAHLVLRLTYG